LATGNNYYYLLLLGMAGTSSFRPTINLLYD